MCGVFGDLIVFYRFGLRCSHCVGIFFYVVWGDLVGNAVYSSGCVIRFGDKCLSTVSPLSSCQKLTGNPDCSNMLRRRSSMFLTYARLLHLFLVCDLRVLVSFSQLAVLRHGSVALGVVYSGLASDIVRLVG